MGRKALAANLTARRVDLREISVLLNDHAFVGRGGLKCCSIALLLADDPSGLDVDRRYFLERALRGVRKLTKFSWLPSVFTARTVKPVRGMWMSTGVRHEAFSRRCKRAFAGHRDPGAGLYCSYAWFGAASASAGN